VDTTNGTKRSFRIFVFGMRRVRLLMGSGKSNSVTFVDVLLIFENFPVWSVGLKPSRIRHMHLLGFESHFSLIGSLVSRGFPISVFQRLLNTFGTQRVFYHKSHSDHLRQMLTLVSGSLSHFSSVVGSALNTRHTQILGVLDHHFYGRLRSGCPSGIPPLSYEHILCWTKIRHETVGGITASVGLFCSTTKLESEITVLQRTLQHVVDYGVRPKCIR
jgi:hypothetical protein